MIKPIELVIFDCDGVLVDIERIAARVQVALGAELGWPLTEDEVVVRFMGRSPAAIHEQIAARLGPDTAAIWSDRFEQLHREAVDAELAPVDGLPEALDALTLPTCVASNGSHDKMRHTLGRTGLYERFAGRIYSATEVSRSKPAPDLFLHAARRWASIPKPALSSRTANPASTPPAPPACEPSATPADSPRPNASKATTPSSSTTCASCRTSSPNGSQPSIRHCPPTRFDNCSFGQYRMGR